MAIERRLFLQLHRAQRIAVAYVNARTLDALGVSSAQLGTMYYLAKHPRCSATDVADVLDLNKSAVSGMLRRLEAAGLLARTPNPKDGRGSFLELTEQGENVRARSLPLTRKLQAEMTEGFTQDEVDTVARFLSAIVERFGRDDLEVEHD